jgi:hypothetical protein
MRHMKTKWYAQAGSVNLKPWAVKGSLAMIMVQRENDPTPLLVASIILRADEVSDFLARFDPAPKP